MPGAATPRTTSQATPLAAALGTRAGAVSKSETFTRSYVSRFSPQHRGQGLGILGISTYTEPSAKRRSVDLGRDPGPVQVGGDAAEVEGPAGAEDHAQVDVLGSGHDPLVEHDPDLLGQPLQGPREHFGGGGRAVAAGQQGDHLRVDREV